MRKTPKPSVGGQTRGKLSDCAALDQIQFFLSGKPWSLDRLEEIAVVVRVTGRIIEDSSDDGAAGAGPAAVSAVADVKIQTNPTSMTSRQDHTAVEAALVLMYPAGPDMGRRWALDDGELFVGRGSDCDILIDRDSVSRRHARFYRVDDQWFVEDLGSTNGSYINDTPIQRAPLREGDFVKIGSAIFKFILNGGLEWAFFDEIAKRAHPNLALIEV